MIELWRVMHFLTGRDYVHLRNSAGEMIRRVRYTHEGRPYARYFAGHLVWLDRESGWTVTPLTTPKFEVPD